MDTQAMSELVKDLDTITKQASTNKRCLYSGCNNQPIASHIIARKTLKLIAEEGHILTWQQATNWDTFHAIQTGKKPEQFTEDPTSVGIGNKRGVTSPLFCKYHDETLFTSLEKDVFSFQPEQILLLAYRTICSLICPDVSLIENLVRFTSNHDFDHYLSRKNNFLKLERLSAQDSILDAKKRYEHIYQTHDYSQLAWSAYQVNLPQCIAATHSSIPIINSKDVTSVANGVHKLTGGDFAHFSFLPHESSHGTICIVSWLKGSRLVERFLDLYKINQFSEKKQRDFFLSYAFKSSNLYISPVWWQNISESERAKCRRIRSKLMYTMKDYYIT